MSETIAIRLDNANSNVKDKDKVKDKKETINKPDVTRRCSAYECSPYVPLSNAFTLDHKIHAHIAKLTGGISPVSLGLAGFDWFAHLMFSPSKRYMLRQSLFEKTESFQKYALQAPIFSDIDPVIKPSSDDQRFKSQAWKRWPFNILQQGFLLSQSWWHEATNDIRGISEHHWAKSYKGT